jgi:uncharacterized protein (DUF302 family)
MENAAYSTGRQLAEPYETALPRVLQALREQGFGVITEIDIKKTMKDKLGLDVPPHTILGACNPTLAHSGLEVEPDLGVLLPCNVAVYQSEGGTRVAAVSARAMLGMVGNDRLEPIATQIQERLDRVLQSL